MQVIRNDVEADKLKEKEKLITQVMNAHGYDLWWDFFTSVRSKGGFLGLGKKVAELSTCLDEDVDLRIWVKARYYESEKELIGALEELESKGITIRLKVEPND